jgi:hypothetical protein
MSRRVKEKVCSTGKQIFEEPLEAKTAALRYG